MTRDDLFNKMIFQIDFNAATALYRQLVDQVRFAAAAGRLKPRDPLPTIRPLAKQLHLNRNTVAKAYAELESLGVIRAIPGKGCFIEAVNTPFTTKIRHNLLATKIDAALVAAHQLQVDAVAFSALVAERNKFFQRRTANTPEDLPEETMTTTTTATKKTEKTTLKVPRANQGAKKTTPISSLASPAPAELPTPKPTSSSPTSPPPDSTGDSEGWTPLTD
jgi:GntR family transcriptional regulator